MTGSMYAAIAGMKTHMSKLSVIGNNVANVNTAGYKTQRTIFRDSMYTMYSSGSNGTAIKGSQNPSQIGYGSQISTIDINMSTGTFAPGSPMDCMIRGDGFFLTGDKDVAAVINPSDPASFKSLNLTRVGDFKFGADGYLVDGSGGCVYGFLTTGVDGKGNPVISDQLVPIRLPRMSENGVKYPSTGINFNEPIKDSVGDDEQKPNPFVQLDSISIDKTSGRISGTVKGSDQWITVGFLAIGNVTNVNGVTHDAGFYYKCGDGAGDLSITMLGGVQKDLQVQTSGGKFSSITHVNGSLVQDTTALPEKSKITSAGQTELNVGGLEGSNVDLATEISEMITTQRGYQANTRIITVTDSMLEELVNMKR